MVASYCWPWASKKDPVAMDVEIPEHGFGMQWNLTKDGGLWIMAPGSVDQIGCIHTCQGLELDYVGVIVGADFVVRDGVVVTDGLERDRYDKTIRGFKGMLKREPERARREVDEIIKNTYRTLMSRGMKGCYVWSVDEETNAWLQEAAGRALLGGLGAEAVEADEELPFRVLSDEEAAGSDRAVPLYEMAVAAGVFSGEQVVEAPRWVELPEPMRGGPDYFVARVVGESMNRRVPSGSWCLFRARPAGTRAGKVVLVQAASITDPEWGGRFKLKVYGGDLVGGGRVLPRISFRGRLMDPLTV